jgi:hypothetical protein
MLDEQNTGRDSGSHSGNLCFRGVHKSSKKLLEQSQKLEKLWSHVFTGTIGLTSGSDSWYRKLRELLETQQSQPVWISETKVDQLSHFRLFIFTHTARLICIYFRLPSAFLFPQNWCSGNGFNFSVSRPHRPFSFCVCCFWRVVCSKDCRSILPTCRAAMVPSGGAAAFYRRLSGYEVHVPRIPAPQPACSVLARPFYNHTVSPRSSPILFNGSGWEEILGYV